MSNHDVLALLNPQLFLFGQKRIAKICLQQTFMLRYSLTREALIETICESPIVVRLQCKKPGCGIYCHQSVLLTIKYLNPLNVVSN